MEFGLEAAPEVIWCAAVPVLCAVMLTVCAWRFRRPRAATHRLAALRKISTQYSLSVHLFPVIPVPEFSVIRLDTFLS